MATVEGTRGDLVTLAVDGDVAHHNILELRASRPATKDYGKFPIWVILGGVVFQCGSWISNYSNVGRFGYIRRLHCLTIPIWPFLRPQRLNALHTAYRTTLSMDCHSICDSPITHAWIGVRPRSKIYDLVLFRNQSENSMTQLARAMSGG